MQQILLKFSLDFLEHSYEIIIQNCLDKLQKASQDIEAQDYINFFYVASFGLESFSLSLEKTIRMKQEIEKKRQQARGNQTNSLSIGPQATNADNIRGDEINKQSCQFKFILSGLQTQIHHLIYQKFIEECQKQKKKEFDTKKFHSTLNLFYQILRITSTLSKSPNIQDQENSKLIKRVVFSRDYSRILKIAFDNYEPRIHAGPYVKKLILTLDLYLTLLSEHAGNRVLKVRTNKRVKNKLKIKQLRQKNKMLAQDAEDDLTETGQNNPLTNGMDLDEIGEGEGEELEEEESIGEEDDLYTYEERKLNYTTELANFSDYQTISKMLGQIQGDKLIYNDSKVNEAVYNYIYRIVYDLESEWIFFQIDYLTILHSLCDNPTLKGHKSFSKLEAVIKDIFKSFFKLLQKNTLAGVETLFRIPDIRTKELIFNNYKNIETDMDYEDLDQYEQEEYIDQNENYDALREIEDLWDEAEDTILRLNYKVFKTDANVVGILKTMLRAEGFKKSDKLIRKRVRELGLDKSIDNEEHLIKSSVRQVRDRFRFQPNLKDIFGGSCGQNEAFCSFDFKKNRT